MRTKTQKLEYEKPVSIPERLTLHDCYPALGAIEQEFADAEARRDTAHADLRVLEQHVEQLGAEAARSGDHVAYQRAFTALQAAKALIGSHEAAVRRARSALDTARARAIDACHAEAHRQQECITQAAAPLLAALAELDALEQALRETVKTLPTKPGEGWLNLGSYRDRQPVGAAR